MTANRQSPLTQILVTEIEHSGPVPFSRFMELALYDRQYGYYRRGDPFGARGDFFTAEQIQPVFGRLIAQYLRRWRKRLRLGTDFTVVEMGPGRCEMAGALSEFRYIPVESVGGHADLPAEFSGAVFANEFFDALPVRVVRRTGGVWTEMLVGWDAARGEFCWLPGAPASGQLLEYVRRTLPSDGGVEQLEVCTEARLWVRRLAAHLRKGIFLFIDYGYEPRELKRFPQGTLMSYRRHTAIPDVLCRPGEQDITAHVNFAALEEEVRLAGMQVLSRQTLAAFLMDTGAEDQFAEALSASSEKEAFRNRMQLKTLLFQMGETFHVLLALK